MDDQGFTGLTVSWHDGLARWELVCYTSHEREGGAWFGTAHCRPSLSDEGKMTRRDVERTECKALDNLKQNYF